MRNPDYLELAKKAALRAGEIQMSYFRGSHSPAEKEADRTVVTAADKESERAILDLVCGVSGFGALSEECGQEGERGEYYWVVDPLDGTHNYARGLPFFVTSIALMRGDSVEVGVIYQPLTKDLYWAAKGEGAFCNGAPIKVSSAKSAGRPVLTTEHGHALESQKRLYRLFLSFEGYFAFRTFGATALELCYLACGASDAFITSGDSIWDYAAGLCISSEAGAQITDWRGEPWTAGNEFIAAAAPWVHKELIRFSAEFQD